MNSLEDLPEDGPSADWLLRITISRLRRETSQATFCAAIERALDYLMERYASDGEEDHLEDITYVFADQLFGTCSMISRGKSDEDRLIVTLEEWVPYLARGQTHWRDLVTS